MSLFPETKPDAESTLLQQIKGQASALDLIRQDFQDKNVKFLTDLNAAAGRLSTLHASLQDQISLRESTATDWLSFLHQLQLERQAITASLARQTSMRRVQALLLGVLLAVLVAGASLLSTAYTLSALNPSLSLRDVLRAILR